MRDAALAQRDAAGQIGHIGHMGRTHYACAVKRNIGEHSIEINILL